MKGFGNTISRLSIRIEGGSNTFFMFTSYENFSRNTTIANNVTTTDM